MRSFFASLNCQSRTWAKPSKTLAAVCIMALPAALPAQTAHYAGVQTVVAGYSVLLSNPYQLAVDASGSVYVAIPDSQTVFQEKPTGSGTYTRTTVKTVSNNLDGLAVDGLGNIYVLDENSSTHTLYKETPSGSTFTESSASLTLNSGESTAGIAVDAAGNVFLLANGTSSSRVVKETPSGSTYTQTEVLTGLPTTVYAIAVDAADNLYITGASSVIKETLAAGVYTPSTVATGIVNSAGLVVDAAGNVFVSDTVNGTVLKETLFAGTYTQTVAIGGLNTTQGPEGVGVDPSGNIYVADYNGTAVLKQTLTAVNFGSVTVGNSGLPVTLKFIFDTGGSIASPSVLTQGTDETGFVAASLGAGTCSTNGPGHVYIAGDTCTLNVDFTPDFVGARAGAVVLKNNSGIGVATAYVYGIGLGPVAAFDSGVISTLPITFLGTGAKYINGVTPDNSGNLYLVDETRCIVERFSIATSLTTPIAGNGTCGYNGDGGLATSASFKRPTRLVVNGRGDLYIADGLNYVVRKVDGVSGFVSVVAGTPGVPGYGPDGVAATSTTLNFPTALVLDGANNLYIADSPKVIRRVDGITGVITTVAGNASLAAGFSGDGAVATSAQLNHPLGLTIDSASNLYIADSTNNVIRKVTASTGFISTVAGSYPTTCSGTGNYFGDLGAATSARLCDPEGLAVDAGGNLYIGDSTNDVVRKVDAATGVITTAAGVFNNGVDANSGDGGPAKLAGLSYQQDIAIDVNGNLYLDDANNGVIRRVTPASAIASFGGFYPGSSSAALDVTLTNNGNANLNLTALTVPTNFNLGGADTTCISTTSLTPGQSCVLGIRFLPTTTGTLAGTIALTDNVEVTTFDGIASPAQTVTTHGIGLVVNDTKTAISGVPTTLVSGGNLGTSVTVALEDVNGALVTAANSPVTVTVTGPYGYTQAVTLNAVSGIATFNLTSLVLMDGGVYTVTATSPGLTASSAQTTVSDLTALISLAVSSNSATQGTPVTLTATATRNGAPLTPGQINFTYQQVVYGVTLAGSFGTGQLTGAGTSVLTIEPGPGSYVITAAFPGTGSTTAAVSAMQTVVITSPGVSTLTNISYTGAPGNYALTGTVTQLGLFPAPAGTVSFLDATSANQTVGTGTLGVSTSAYSLVPAVNSPVSNPAVGVVVAGDLNGDGIADLVTLQTGTTPVTMQVQLGTGNGVFAAPTTYNLGSGVAPLTSAVIADVNNDGHADLVIASQYQYKIFILLGDGTGNFTVPGAGPNILSVEDPSSLAVADLDHDGNLDLIATDAANSTARIFLGNGDGTFKPQVGYAVGQFPTGVAVADFNHDGIPDLAVTNVYPAAVAILLGNGDGTFQPQTQTLLNYYAGPPVAASLRGNGVMDLVVPWLNVYAYWVFLGNNDGTFAPRVAYFTSGNIQSMALADLNHDGKPDLIALADAGGTPFASHIFIRPGKGDGTFGPEQDFNVGNASKSFALADLNNDGVLDLVTADNGSGTNTILLGQETTTATATATGVSVPGPGPQSIDASYSGDQNHLASLSSTIPLLPLASTTAVTANPMSALSGAPIVLTANIVPTPTGAGSAGTVTFYNGVTLLGTAPVIGSTASYTSSGLLPGYNNITAVYTGNVVLGPSTSPSLFVFVGPQTSLSLTASASTAVFGTPVTLTVSGTNLPGGTALNLGQVTFSYQQTVNGLTLPGSFGMLQMTSAGTAVLTIKPGPATYVITANYAGTTLVGPSVSAPVTLTVAGTGALTSITSLLPTGSVGNYTLAATVTGFGPSPGGTVSFLNTTNGNASIATAPLDQTTVAFSPVQATGSPLSNPAALWVATGDFNNDGIADIATVTGGGSVKVQLGIGDGTFAAATTTSVTAATAIVAADVSGDGKLDLIVSDATHGTVLILLGDGAGNFQTPSGPQILTAGSGPSFLATSDLNHDGKLDIVVTNNGDNTVSAFLGNGDGTFQPQQVWSTGSGPTSVAIADINSDGIPDIITGNVNDNTITVGLGNGDGTFQTLAPISYPDGDTPGFVSVGSLRNNGINDLVTGDTSGYVYVFLGKNDGTFSTGVQYYNNSNTVTQALLLDVNHDGKLDIVAAADDTISVYIGNGDGTVGSSQDTTILTSPATFENIAAADFNNDGVIDLVTANTSSANLTVNVLLGQQSATATATAVYVLGTGTQNVDASFPGDAVHAASLSTTVPLLPSIQSPSTLLLASSGSTIVAGASVTFTATVAPVPVGASFGTVSFFSNGTLLGTTAVTTTGLATYTTTALLGGVDAITAVYSGNAALATATATTLSETVVTATTTAVSAPAATGIYGQPVVLTATITSAPIGSPAGTISFYQGSTLLGTATPNGTGIATLSVTTLVAGVDSITAVYSGSSLYGTSTSPAFVFTTSQLATATVLSSSSLTSTYSQAIVLTGTVTPASTDTPAGTVSFYQGTTLLGTSTLNGAGIATLSFSSLVAGADAITAVYSGSTDFTTSTSAAITITVAMATTATALTSSTLTPGSGQSIVLTAKLAPAPSDTPPGTVRFYKGTTLLGTSMPSAGGVATFSISTLPIGVNIITAVYSGSTDFAGSTSSALTITVQTLSTATVVTSSNLAPNFGTSIVLTATVSPASTDTPPGTVSFFTGATLLGTGVLSSGGVATLTATIPIGVNAITAVYSGSATYATSTSAILPVTARALSVIVLGATPTTQLFNNPIVLTAQVSSATAGAETGTVTFLDGTTVIATATLGTGAQAIDTIASLADGPHSITAAYSGDGTFQPSTSSGTPIAITVADLNLALGGDNNKTVVPGAAVTYNFPLSPLVTPTFIYDVALTATGLPPGATYTFSPATIPAGSGSLPVAFTVQTAKTTALLSRPSSRDQWYALAFVLLLPLAGARRFRTRMKQLKTLPRILLVLLFGALSMAAVAGLGGCGSGGFFGKPQGQSAYTITINATSGSLVRTSSVQLNLE